MPKKKSPKKKAPRASTPKKGEDSQVRLQKVLASAGFGSRRSCEDLITDGRVVVDNEIVTELGTKVDPKTSKISVDGSLIKQPKLIYYALNKPTGIVTTNRDPQGRPRVVDLVPDKQRVFPVGRLDRSSEGLILLTNDGELSDQLTHPRFGVKKTYLVRVAGKVESETMRDMKKGIHFTEGKFHVDGARIKKHLAKSTELEIVLREGKNREIRRILARLGHKVLQLKRIAIGNIRLGQLPTGANRLLTNTEVKKLREEVVIAMKGRASDEPAEPESSGSRRPRKKTATSSSAGPRKRVATKKKAPQKRRSDPTVRLPDRVIISGETESMTIGTVIGDETTTGRPRRAKKKKAADKRSGGKRSGGARSGKAASSRGRAAKKKTVKKKTARAKKGSGSKRRTKR